MHWRYRWGAPSVARVTTTLPTSTHLTPSTSTSSSSSSSSERAATPRAAAPSARGTGERRLAASLWCAGLATFALLYAPQGLLTEVSASLAVSPSRAALLVSGATLGLAASVLPWAWVSDRVGRPEAMRLAAVASAVLAVLVPWLPTFELLVVGRVVQGAALGGIPALAIALVHDSAAPGRAAALAGSYVAATSVGGLAGRLLSVPVAEHLGWRLGLVAVGACLTALMALLVVLLPHGVEHKARRAAARRGAAGLPGPVRSGGHLRAHLRDGTLVSLFCIGGLLVGGLAAVFNYLPFRLEAQPYGLAPTVVSLVFLTYLAGTVGSRLAGALTDRWGPRVVLALACVLMGVGALVTLARPLVVVVLGVTVLTTGLFVGHAVAASRVGARATTGRAQATALYTVVYYAGASLFGWLAGHAWDARGWPAVVALVVTLAAVALLLAVRPQAGRRGRRSPGTPVVVHPVAGGRLVVDRPLAQLSGTA